MFRRDAVLIRMASQRETCDAAAHDRGPQGSKPVVCHRCDDLIPSIDALHAAILELTEILKGLGRDLEPRYSTSAAETSGMLDEESMANRLGITRRVLARHRKNGKLPGCWIMNGRQTRWHVHETMEAWKRGIA